MISNNRMAASNILLVIAGPTASGKTALSIALAQHFGTSILSFDSRQCYRELNIGVAKPTAAELQTVPHYFINSHSIHQPVDAAGFEQYALSALDELFCQNSVVIAVGGTGLYMKVLCEGIDAMPGIPNSIREAVRKEYEQQGIVWLQQTIQQEDPLFAESGEMQNPHRMLRALEVMRTSGKSIRHFQGAQKAQRPFTSIKIGLELPRPELYSRIIARVDRMVKEGLVEEARSLYSFRNLQALQTVGYRELFEYFDNAVELEQAIENIKTNTRHYAKRQMTWFRKDEEIEWFHPGNADAIRAFAQEKIAAK